MDLSFKWKTDPVCHDEDGKLCISVYCFTLRYCVTYYVMVVAKPYPTECSSMVLNFQMGKSFNYPFENGPFVFS